MTPPDAATIDWVQISGWVGGGATVLTTIGIAIWRGVSRAIKATEGQPAPAATVHTTDIYTTDSVALGRMTGAMDTANVLMTEGNALRREATDERRSLRQALDDNTEMTEKSVSTMTELRTDVRRLTDELIRSGIRVR